MLALLFNAIAVLLLVFMMAYLRQKAKSIATREDIKQLTHIVEGIKSEYALELEAARNKNELRRAGIEKRLQAHQEARSHLQYLFSNLHKPEFCARYQDAQEWAAKNCLYLDPAAREAYYIGMRRLDLHNELSGAPRPLPEHVMEMIKMSFREAEKAIITISESAELPPLRDEH